MRRFFWFLVPHTLFLAATTLFDMFVAFYFYKFGTGSFVAPLAFTAAAWAVVPLGHSLGASLSRSISLPACLKIGAIATGATFALVAALATISVPWWALLPVGVVYGLARSIYWTARHQIDYRVSRAGHRDNYFGWQTSLSTGISTALGIVCGIAVEAFPQVGYTAVFGLGAILLVLAALSVREHPKEYGSFSAGKLRQLTSLNPAFRRVFLASILRGANHTIPVAIQVFTFAALSRELPVAGLSGFGAALALGIGGMVSHRVRPGHRRGIAWIAASMLLVLGAALALMPTGLVGSTYLILGPIAGILLVIPTLAADNTIFSHDDSVVAEYAVAREIGHAIGRLATAAPLVFLLTNPANVGPYLLLLSVAYPAQVLLLMGRRSASLSDWT